MESKDIKLIVNSLLRDVNIVKTNLEKLQKYFMSQSLEAQQPSLIPLPAIPPAITEKTLKAMLESMGYKAPSTTTVVKPTGSNRGIQAKIMRILWTGECSFNTIMEEINGEVETGKIYTSVEAQIKYGFVTYKEILNGTRLYTLTEEGKKLAKYYVLNPKALCLPPGMAKELGISYNTKDIK